ncbi:prepilin-type N-terminal cleavage/methylation domain-containing protein [Akkermansiaceae bacterium]|nr:prepilin-type N-terminal cleavage/methylation domain-containing protein [Akkermansiaceae bacterium]
MKIPSNQSPKTGFTLVELLVVIAIIATLAAAAFSIGPAAMNKARKLSAQNAATSVATAVNQFYTEYSALPDPGTNTAETEFSTTAGNGIKLLEILAGLDDSDQNARKIRFFSGKEAKNRKDGVEYSSDGKAIRGMYDPWGRPFYIRMDYDYDERLTVKPGSTPAVTLNGRRVAVYSLGVPEDSDAKPNTIVKTW